MIPIELKKRYPHSREEDITDAFMRGYQACAAQGGDAEMDNCQVQTPQNYMQQSRHNDGTDLISRADAIAYIDRIINSGLGRNKSLDYIHKYISLLPSADAVHGEWLDGWEVIRELSETRCMYNCFDEDDRPMYEAMTSAIDIVRQMMGGARMKGGDDE